MSAAPVTGLEAYLDVEEQGSKKIGRGTLFQLISWILRHPAPLFCGLLLVLLGTSAALLEPRLFGYAIDDAIVPRNWEKLRLLSGLYLTVTTLRIVMMIAQTYCFETLGQRVTSDLRNELFSHLMRLPVSVYDKTPAGRLLTRVTNDIAGLGEMFSAGFMTVASNALLVLGILTWLIVLDYKVGLIAASVFPVLMAAGIYFSSRLRVAYREMRSKLSALNAFLAENLLGIKVVHLFNRQKLHLSRFDRFNQWYTDAQFGSIHIFALFQPSITLAAGLSVALVIWFGGLATLNGSMKVGVLVAFFSYSMTLFQPVRELAEKWNLFLSGMSSAERIFSVFSWSTEMERYEDDVAPIPNLRGHIIFENVWFAYENKGDEPNWVLKDFSLEIQPGMQVGVVGHTGAGKTTLISLLMRFYEPQRGRILLDGRDLREYDKRALRSSIGIIQQDVFLFSGSARDNATFWGAAPVPAESGIELREEILNERGSNLSMGERQVLAFARAMAARPSIWILDEATANMDSESETRLQKALARESKDKTAILIAHRLATVRSADLIVVLHQGALLEKGNHEELIRQDGLYARLYRYQEAAARVAAAAVSEI